MKDKASLANYVQDVPERYVPGVMKGELAEAEHLCRYLWASACAQGRRVLDAGCGMAYGSAILARAGASEVIGVDIAPTIIEAAGPEMPANVSLEVADLRSLSFPDGRFDLVVCFEVIEHVADPELILDELARVTAPDGILLVSSPNRDVYPAGNPHHLHEFTPPELEVALRRRFERVAVLRQHPWTATLITADASVVEGAQPVELGRALRTTGIETSAEAYSVAIASNGELPRMDDVLVLGGDLEFRHWIELFDGQRRAIEELEFQVTEGKAVASEMTQVGRELLAAEQLLAELPELRDQVAASEKHARELDRQVAKLTDELRDARRIAERASGVVADMKASVSWRITRPIRDIKRALRPKRP